MINKKWKVLVGVVFSVVVFSGFALIVPVKAAEPEWTRVAMGEYRSNLGEGEETDTWVLWKTPQGYAVEGTRVSKDKYKTVMRSMEFELDGNFHLLAYKVTPALGAQESWPEEFGCQLEAEEIRCWRKRRGFYGNEKVVELRDKLAINAPYDLIPVFPWFAGSVIQRLHSEDGEKVKKMQIVGLDDAGFDDAVDFFLLEGQVSFEGIDSFSMAGKEVSARKFNVLLKAPGSTGETLMSWTYWIAAEGVVLGAEVVGRTGERGEAFRLVRYAKQAEFGPGK